MRFIYCCVQLAFTPFNCRFYHILSIHLPVDGHSGCSQFGAIMNNSAKSIHMLSLCVDICFHFLWVYTLYLGVRLLDQMVQLCWTFKETAKLFSKVIVPSYIPISSEWVFGCSSFSPTCGVSIFNFRHSNRSVTVIHSGFNFHFPNE